MTLTTRRSAADLHEGVPIVWHRLPDPERGEVYFLYAAEVDGERWRLTLNDFPAEPMYTLYIGEEAVASFDDCPKAWVMPYEDKPASGALDSLRGDVEAEASRDEAPVSPPKPTRD